MKKSFHIPLAKILLSVLILLPTGSAQAQAVDMDELMDDVLQGVQQETRQSIKQQIKTETREVLSEEQVIPSQSRSGTYTGPDSDGSLIQCDLTVSSSSVRGTCFDTDSSDRAVITGSLSNDSLQFSFTIFETSPPCTGQGTGSGQFAGSGAPGTTLRISVNAHTCGGSPETITLTKS